MHIIDQEEVLPRCLAADREVKISLEFTFSPAPSSLSNTFDTGSLELLETKRKGT